MSAGFSEWSAAGPSESCTEKQFITSALAQRFRRTSVFAALMCANAGSSANEPGGFREGGCREAVIAGAIFSKQENFLFRCGKVIGCE
ncbi:hypothetical protein A5647_26020 [Mycobacterium sp. 1100029.7]|nr:hypothetical protein A5647_26020 [Mycobacterium sp. 1100029.7]